MWLKRSCPPRPTLATSIEEQSTWQLLQAIRRLHKHMNWLAQHAASEAERTTAQATKDHLASTLKHHPLRDDLIRDWERFGNPD